MEKTAAERIAPLDMSAAEFREAGHALVDRIADFLGTLPKAPVSPNETPSDIRALLPAGGLPRHGTGARKLLDETASLLFGHSLFNGHPRFFAYITSSAAPVGALADLLASSVNSNLGGWDLSPAATEIERQTVSWIAELIGFPAGSGILSSGGNMANFIAFLAARRAMAGQNVRTDGIGAPGCKRLRVYTSQETHTWIQKAADLFGLGTDAIRWIPVDAGLRMDVNALAAAVHADRESGDLPFLVIGTGGSVSTGAIDPLGEIAALCKKEQLWFHVDGAYGGFAAALPDAPADLKALSLADSIAIDPHKWLYAPIEAGCTLVRNPEALPDTFAYEPTYYAYTADDEEEPINYHKYGPQNSRGFRALKVWLGLRNAGRDGYERMIGDDIALSRELYRLVSATPELEALTQGLSIATFRYVPPGLPEGESTREYLNALNEALMQQMRLSGGAWLSNALVNGKFALRACIVNFRTTRRDVEAVPPLAVALGRELDGKMRPQSLR